MTDQAQKIRKQVWEDITNGTINVGYLDFDKGDVDKIINCTIQKALKLCREEFEKNERLYIKQLKEELKMRDGWAKKDREEISRLKAENIKLK